MAAKRTTVRSNKFERIGAVALDARKRVSLAKAFSALNGSLVKKAGAAKNGDLRFEIFLNPEGQILLSPLIIPPEEAWLYKTPKALASVRRGLRQSATGKRYNLGSFVQYADDEID